MFSKLLDLFLKFVTLLLAIVLAVSVIAALVSFNIEQITLRPENVKALLRDNHLYSDLMPQLAAEAMPQLFAVGDFGGSQIPVNDIAKYLNDDDWIFLVNELFPSDWLQTQVESMIDAAFAWLEGDTASLVLAVDLGSVQQRLDETTRREIAQRLVNSWPECTEKDITSFAEQELEGNTDTLAVCQPVGDYAFLYDSVVTMVSSELSGLSQALNPSDGLEITSREFHNFEQIQMAARWSPFVPLAVMSLIFLSARSWAGRLRWWSIPIMLGGLIALLLALVVPMSLELIILPFGFSLPAALLATLNDILGIILIPITRAVTIQAGVMIGVGLSFFAAASIIAERAKTASVDADAPVVAASAELKDLLSKPHRRQVIKLIKSIRRDLKARRTVRLLLRTLWIVSILLSAGILLADFYFPEIKGLIPYGITLVLLVGLISAFAIWVPPYRLARRLDTRFKLYDRATTALEIETAKKTLTYLESVLLTQANEILSRVRREIKNWPQVPWLEAQTLLASLAIVGGVLYTTMGWAEGARSAPQPLPPLGDEYLRGLADNPRLAHPYIWDTEDASPAESSDLLPPNSAQEAMQILAEALGDEAMAAGVVQALEHGDPQAAAEALRRLADQSDKLSDTTLDELAEAMRQAAQEMSEIAPEMASQLERTANVLDGTGTAAQILHEGAEKLSEISPLYAGVIEQMAENVAANDYEAAAESLQQAADALSAIDPQLAENLEAYVDAVAQQDIQAIADALQGAAEMMEGQDPDLARELDKTARALEGETPGLTARSLEDLAKEMAALEGGTSGAPQPGGEMAQVPGASQSGQSSEGGQNSEGGQDGGSGAGAGAGSMIGASASEAAVDIDLDSLNLETIPVELDSAEGGGRPGEGPPEGPPSTSFSSQSGFVPVSNIPDEIKRTGQDLLTYPNELIDVVRTYFSPPR